MKKGSILLNIAAVLMAALPLCASAQTMRGDFDMDGSVGISDVTALVNYLLTDQPVTPPAVASDTVMVNGVPLVMVRVDGGTYMRELGQPWTVGSYSIGQTEVTIELWNAVMGSTPQDNMMTAPLNPVEYVSWNDCQEFIDALNALTGMDFRLPTEREWEYAACGGRHTLAYTYAGSNDLDEVAWHKQNIPEYDPYHQHYYSHAQTVATKAPNELGLYDMSGNVSELCQDISSAPTGNRCALRGGSSYGQMSSQPATDCTVTAHKAVSVDESGLGIGFRLAL